MNSEGLNFLGRIAEALERQVQQTDESAARQDRWRDENVRMRDDDIDRRARQREEELHEAREVNLALINELKEAIAKMERFSLRLATLETAMSATPAPEER